jgi:hypothetical protein
MHDHDALDLMALVGAERFLDAVGIGARTPLFLLDDDLKPVTAGELDPEMAELAEAGGEQLVARRARIGEGRFPGAGAALRINHDLAVPGLENLLEVFEQRQSQLGKVRGTMVLHDDMHGAQDAIRHIGRSRNE